MSRRRSASTAFSLFSFQDIITSVTGIMILVTLIMALDLMTRTVSAPPVATQQTTAQSEATVEELEREVALLRSRLQSGVASLANLPSFDASTLERILRQTVDDQTRLDRDSASKQKEFTKKQQQLQSVKSADQKDKDNEEQTLEDLKERVDDLTVKLESIESKDRMFFKQGIVGKDCWVAEITSRGVMVGKIGVNAPPKSFPNASSFRVWLTSLNKAKEAMYLVIKPGGKSMFETIKPIAEQAGFDIGFTVEPAGRQFLDPQIGAGTP